MFETNRALDIAGQSDADAFADRFTFARAQHDGSPIFMHTRESTLTDFINGLCKVLLALCVFGLVLVGCILAFNHINFRAEVGSAATPPNQQINALRSEVANLNQEQRALRSELALLTGQGRVLAKLVERFQEQRRVNGAHSNAIRQLYSTTGLIGACLPSLDEQTGTDIASSRPVQVTPVSVEPDDQPRRVVVTPAAKSEPTTDKN